MKISEVEVGKKAVEYFKEFGWEIFQEVATSQGNIIDIVVKLNANIIHCIELKTSLNLDVINQAYRNKIFGHYSSIVVPAAKRTDFVERVCKDYGLGLYYCNDYNHVLNCVVKPSLNRKILKLNLEEKQKSYAEAGNSKGMRWTPYQATKENIIFFVQKNPGKSIKEVIQSIKHHYKTESTAISCIKQWIGTSALPELEIINKKVYLKGEKNESSM